MSDSELREYPTTWAEVAGFYLVVLVALAWCGRFLYLSVSWLFS